MIIINNNLDMEVNKVEIDWAPRRPKLRYTEINGKREGELTEWWDNRQVKLTCNYRDGLLHGDYIEWWPDGCKRAEYMYVAGERDGPAKTYHRSGLPESTRIYLNGKLHGEYREWWPNGNKRTECGYADDLREGKYTSWHSTGGVFVEANYQLGFDHGVRLMRNVDGSLLWHSRYQNGKKVEELIKMPSYAG